MSEERQLGSTYMLEQQLGEGASGHVWSGRGRDGRRWAFKLLRRELASDSGVVNRFVQERRLLASIQHNNVVGVHDLVVEGETLAIVMDLVDGSDLRGELRARGALDPARVSEWGAQVAAALQAAHRHDVIHRDVKPENVLIDAQTGEAKLTDFGIARLVDGAQRSTMLLGTPLYMAPEIAEGRQPTPAADLYSLGVMLYEMCCGVSPFAGRGSAMATLRAHATEEPGRPGGVPDALWAVILGLLAKDPAARPARAGDVANQLAALGGELEGMPSAPILASPPPGRPIAVTGDQAGTVTHLAALPETGPTMFSPGQSPGFAGAGFAGAGHSAAGFSGAGQSGAG